MSVDSVGLVTALAATDHGLATLEATDPLGTAVRAVDPVIVYAVLGPLNL